jgi:hypothetical protein
LAISTASSIEWFCFVRDGTSQWKNIRKVMPTSVRTAPTGVKSNIVKGVPVRSARSCETTMFGDVPICVINPPSRAENAIGIRYFDGETPERREN